MNAGLERNHPTIEFYDSDYPSEFFGPYPENFDATTEFQGVARDVRRYLEIARARLGDPAGTDGVPGGTDGSPAGTDGVPGTARDAILELCCGTGRVSIPLARAGYEVTAVDVAPMMLEQFARNLADEPDDVRDRIDRIEGDATMLSLPRRDYGLVIIAFNSLLAILDGDAQAVALCRAAEHMADDGLLVIDVVNPLQLNIGGDPLPKPFFTRRNVHTGHTYTRFAMQGPFDARQNQRLHGWYDEITADGAVHRTPYSMHWRPVFRFELELMLRAAGLRIETIEGGHNGEAFMAKSSWMFVQAVKG